MNCDTIHRRLLSLERPEQPPADLRGHLASCPACRSWHQRLVEVETRTARLPLPPPERKLAFLDKLRQPAPAPATLRFQPGVRGQEPGFKERGRLKIAIAVAGAAALLLIALGVATWPRGQGPIERTPKATRPSLLTLRLKEDARWAKARTPQQRLDVLSDLADEVHSTARKIAHTDNLKDIDREVDLYREIVQRITSTEAREIDARERTKLLKPLAQRLAMAESQARQLAESPTLRDTPAAVPLRELAAVAREGDQQIRALIQQAAA